MIYKKVILYSRVQTPSDIANHGKIPLIIYVDNYTYFIIIKRAPSLFNDPFFYLGQHYFVNEEQQRGIPGTKR
jgi:hypothetical protein